MGKGTWGKVGVHREEVSYLCVNIPLQADDVALPSCYSTAPPVIGKYSLFSSYQVRTIKADYYYGPHGISVTQQMLFDNLKTQNKLRHNAVAHLNLKFLTQTKQTLACRRVATLVKSICIMISIARQNYRSILSVDWWTMIKATGC